MPETKQDGRVPLYRNIISLIGTLAIAGSAGLILFGFVAQLTVAQHSPYVGIYTYLIFPMFTGLGVVLVLYGMRWEAVRRKKTGGLPSLPYPSIDLNLNRTRRLFTYTVMAGILVATMMAWAGYHGYEFTESVTFCGQVCHTPMEPEFTAYKDSAHARVACVHCHVGEGATWYMRSKLSGARQVLAVALNSYHRPVATPLKHLRPARETCETCHWPEKFFGSKLLQLPHFRYDEENTAEQISLVLKTGGGSKAHGESAGIHWHMVITNKVTYLAKDPKLQEIPWVKIERADGTSEEYRAPGVTPADLAGLELRTMDCMDCHNRPSHNFPTPEAGVNDALYRGRIRKDLPFIMRTAVEALTKQYPTREAAHQGIRQEISGFYTARYPELVKKRAPDLEQAIQSVIAVHDRSVFHDMKVDWQTYPTHIGHRYWPGCFRCHDGRHVSASGTAISSACDGTCHSQPVRSKITPLGVVEVGSGADWHAWQMSPENVDIEGHKRLLCHECHRAGERPFQDCGDCHERMPGR